MISDKKLKRNIRWFAEKGLEISFAQAKRIQKILCKSNPVFYDEEGEDDIRVLKEMERIIFANKREYLKRVR